MLYDFPCQRILNFNDHQTFVKDFLSHQIESIQNISEYQSLPEKDTKISHYHNLNRQSTEEINIDNIKSEKPKTQKKKRIRKYTSNNPNNKKGYWSIQENLKYHYFLQVNARHFIDSQRRKIDKIFKSMSTFIETRQAHQCRSHHQKIQKKWQSFAKILLNLRIQNFSKTGKKYMIQQFQRMGLIVDNFYQDDELRNEQQLYRRIVQQKKCKQQCGEDNYRMQQNNSNIQRLINCHKSNCMCLMMSELYEDQLHI